MKSWTPTVTRYVHNVFESRSFLYTFEAHRSKFYCMYAPVEIMHWINGLF